MRLTIVLVFVVACGSPGAQQDACKDFVCDAPSAPRCDGNTLVTTTNRACTTDSGAPECPQQEQSTDCTAQNQICMDGACIDPCNSFQCTTPPASTCASGTLTTYAQTGTCSASAGVPACSYAPTSTDCTAADRVCDENTGTCADPCNGFTCDMPPASSCVGNVARSYAATGTCSSPGGARTCSYAPSDQDCSLSGQTCNAAACTGPTLFCRVQFPDTITDVPATTQTVYGRVFIQGVTDQSGIDDPVGANVEIELGLGTSTDPTQLAYTATTPNASYGPGSPGYEANNDEYQGNFVVPSAPGTTEYYAFRLSNDANATWLYCDTGNAGSSDGFSNPGLLHIVAP
jgi:hypothetical protein